MDRELKYLLIALIVSVIIASIGYLIYNYLGYGDNPFNYVTKYYGELQPGGVYIEHINYYVGEKGHHMLYRSWNTPLLAEGNGVYIEPRTVVCPQGFIPYIYDHNRNLITPIDVPESIKEKILEELKDAKAHDEVGCYSPEEIRMGTYTVTYRFILHPPLKCNFTNCVLDFKVADKSNHIKYNEFELSTINSQVIYYAPRTLYALITIKSIGSTIYVKDLHEFQSLRLLILTPRNYFEKPGIVENVDLGKYIEDYKLSIVNSELMARFLINIWLFIVLGVPVIAVIIYLIMGRERKQLIQYIDRNIPPNIGEKAWVVNLIYNGEPGVFTKEVLAATVFDLASRGIIDIKRTYSPGGEDIIITINDEKVKEGDLDDYERRVLDTLRMFSVDGRTISLREFEKKLKDRKFVRSIKLSARDVFDSKQYASLAKEAVKSPRKILGVLLGLTIASWILSIVFLEIRGFLEDDIYMVKIVTMGLLAIFAWIPWLIIPSYVLGRWNKDYTIKYYTWMNFIENIKKSGIDKYLYEQAGSTWFKVIAYLLALGEYKFVDKNLARLNNDLAKLSRLLAYYLGSYYPRHFYPRRGGAGGGSGGGFGGGGAGVR